MLRHASKTSFFELGCRAASANSALAECARDLAAGGAAMPDHFGGRRRRNGDGHCPRVANQPQDRAVVANALCRGRPGKSLGNRAGTRAKADLWTGKN